MPLIPYIIFAIQARVLHKKYGVSPEYMEIILRIEYHKKRDKWTEERYKQELLTLAGLYPDDMKKHLKHFEEKG